MIGKDQIVPSGVGLEHICIPVKDDEREGQFELLGSVLFNYHGSVIWLVDISKEVEIWLSPLTTS